MHIINISKREYKRLKPFILSKHTIHTEADFFQLTYEGERKIVKTLFTLEKKSLSQKLRTLESLDTHKEILPESFCIPDHIILVNNKEKAFTIPYIEGQTLASFLSNQDIPHIQHLYYLKKIGLILEELNRIRNTTPLKKIYIGDLHESNIIVNPITKALTIIDLDSCRIGSEYSYASKYLTPFSLIKHQKEKYRRNQIIGNGPGYIIPDANTDIYCYIIIILNYITGNLFDHFKFEDFYDYLNILDTIGINKELLSIMEKILTKENNTNPYEYLETITEEDLKKTKEQAKRLILS